MPHLFKISIQKGSLFFPYCEHICNLKYTCWLFWSQNGLKLLRLNYIILEYWRMYNITFAEMISNVEFGHVFSATFLTQIREQMSGPDLHVFTLKFSALKKTGFSPVRTLKYFQKKIKLTFIHNNGPQKLLIIHPDPFISQSSKKDSNPIKYLP